MGKDSIFLSIIRKHAASMPDQVALEGGDASLTYSQLADEVGKLASEISSQRVSALGLLMDNSPGWVAADLAAMQAGVPLIPIPHFFSSEQVGHLIRNAGLSHVWTDMPQHLDKILAPVGIPFRQAGEIDAGGVRISCLKTGVRIRTRIPAEIAKVTYTSGTTGDPKGVCLTLKAIEEVSVSLKGVSFATNEDRHLCLLPLATLLENIGGIYVPLLAGATCVIPGLAAVGMQGASGLDVQRFISALHESRASTCIMIPQMLQALVMALEMGLPRPQALRFVAVGGATVSPQLLKRAASLGLPIFEGYGLSEAASVVAVNSPAASRIGSVGKPLPHAEVRFAADAEILVSGSLFAGYLGEGDPDFAEGFWPTGDIGYLDEDGFLYLTGRKKHIFITAFGRNVSPEWVERELSVEPGIAQAVVYGEARPFNVALLVPRTKTDEAALQSAVEKANKKLPDYARIRRWIVTDAPFSVANGQLTGTGRPRRAHIWQTYSAAIQSLYEGEA